MTAPVGETGPEPVRGELLALRLNGDDHPPVPSVVERYDRRQRRLVVEWPVEHYRLVILRPGQKIGIDLTRPDDGLYCVDGRLESASNEEPPHLVLRLEGAWQRAQRRETTRHVVEIRPTTAMRYAVDGDHMRFEPLVLNLSTGGMRVRSETELTVDDELELTFGTPSGGAQLRLRMLVLRVDHGDEMWEAGCQFVESSMVEREQIVAFILVQQRALAEDQRSA